MRIEGIHLLSQVGLTDPRTQAPRRRGRALTKLEPFLLQYLALQFSTFGILVPSKIFRDVFILKSLRKKHKHIVTQMN